MANDDNKVLSLSNVKIFKDYINKSMNTSNEFLSVELKNYLNDELIKASDNLSKEYEAELKNLNDKIENIKESGTAEELNELKLQLDALNANFNDKQLALNALNTQLENLSNNFELLQDNIETGAVFSAGQLNEIIKTALIDKTVITDDMVSTENVFSQQIVALIANLGHINAGSIDAGTISGSSIESLNKIAGTNDPVWKIDNAGDGWLAKKNISWDKNGNVKFGKDVKITWESIEDGEDSIEKHISDYDDTIKDFIHNYVIDRTNNAVTQDQLNKKCKDTYDQAKKNIDELNQVVYDNNVSIQEKQELLEKTITDTQTSLTADYENKVANLKAEREAVEEGLRLAIEAGDEALEKEYSKYKAELDVKLNLIYQEYGTITSVVDELRFKINNGFTEEGVLDVNQINKLLSTTLITKTEVGVDQVVTPSLLATSIVSLLGTFGNIDSNTVNANRLEGFTVSAPTAVRNEDGSLVFEETTTESGETIPSSIKRKPATWELHADGSGYIGKAIGADGRLDQNTGISWEAGGNVKFGNKVKLTWGQVTDGDKALNEATGNLKTELEGQIGEAKDAANNAAVRASEISSKLSSLEEKIDSIEGISTEGFVPLLEKLSAWQADDTLSPFEIRELEKDKNEVVAAYTGLASDIDSLNRDLDYWKASVEDGTTPSELTATQIGNLKIDYTTLTDAKDAVEDVYNYYNDNADETTGCAVINEGYPLSKISDYYVLQNSFIEKYQRSATEYITNNRFGSKTTYISAEGIYSGKISGDNIIGTKIKGLTIQSGTDTTLPNDLEWYKYNDDKGKFENTKGGEGPSWQIYNDGSGHLAKGNINWDANGKMNFNVEGSFTSSGNNSSGSLADGALTWDNEKIYLNKNVEFSPNVTISWGNVINTDNVPSKSDIPSVENLVDKDELNNLLEDVVTEETFTTIGNTWIKTTDVEAENLKIRKINTKSSNEDSIEVKDNHIYCVNSEGDKTLIISSNDIDEHAIGAIAGNKEFNKPNNSSISVGIGTNEEKNVPDALGSACVIGHITTNPNAPGNLGSIQYSYTNYYGKNYWDWWNNPTNEYDEVGYLFKNSTLKVRPWLCGFNGSSNLNLLTFVPAISWCIFSPVEIILYKYKNNNGAWGWEIVERKALNAADNIKFSLEPNVQNTISLTNYKWKDSLSPIDTYASSPLWNKTDLDKTFYKVHNDVVSFDITENGKYALKMKMQRAIDVSNIDGGMAPYSIVANDSYTLNNLSSIPCILLTHILGSYNITVEDNNLPSSYTEIGRNGLAVFDGNNILACYNKGVEMKSRIDNNKFYGFKVTPQGLYCCNGKSNYVSLDEYIKSVISSSTSSASEE